MDISGFKNTASQPRSMRELGIALVIASVVLGLFLFVPLTPKVEPPVAAAVVADSTRSPQATPPDAFARVFIEAGAAIVYDLVTGETLYAKNADAQLPLASLTKMLAVYAAVKQLPLNTQVTISENAAQAEAPRLFNAGQVLSLSDLSRLTLTASLNDGAMAIIEVAAGNGRRSQKEALTYAAAAVSLSQTYALNGSGLDMTETLSGGYGSARDMALLAGALVEQAPFIAEATTRPTAKAVSVGGTAFSVKNTNPIVSNIPRLLLSKTGLTDLAGGNLALVFDIGINHPIAIVVLGSSKQARFTDGMALVTATIAYFAGVMPL